MCIETKRQQPEPAHERSLRYALGVINPGHGARIRSPRRNNDVTTREPGGCDRSPVRNAAVAPVSGIRYNLNLIRNELT